MRADYARADLVAALRACGLRPGDVVFSHSNLGFFGRPEGVSAMPALCAMALSAFREVIGEEGTLCVPTFTYSFGSDKAQKRFDVAATPSTCGALTEFVRRAPGARRSADPMFSIAALGPAADDLTRDFDPECFGERSFWRRFLDRDGRICNLNLDAGSTFIHFVERRLGVPYRTDRPFSGTLVEEDGRERECTVVYFSRRLDDPGATPRFEPFDALARARGMVRTARVGRGAVVAITAADTAGLIADTFPAEPRFLTTGG